MPGRLVLPARTTPTHVPDCNDVLGYLVLIAGATPTRTADRYARPEHRPDARHTAPTRLAMRLHYSLTTLHWQRSSVVSPPSDL
jgi:hypothetical protein